MPEAGDARVSAGELGRTEIPGEELPNAVYAGIAAGYLCMLTAAWLAFGSSTATDLDLSIIVTLAAIFLAIPLIIRRTAIRWWRAPEPLWNADRSAGLDTATGWIPSRQAYIQILIIPATLALAASLICGVYVIGV